MKVSIIGLGWFGSALAEKIKDEHEISGTTRSIQKQFDFNQMGFKTHLLLHPSICDEEILNVDVVILNIPPFKDQLKWFQNWKWNKKTHLVFISSTSVYGEIEGNVDEETRVQPTTENAQVLVAEEEWVKTFPQHTIVRFGGLLSNLRHPGNSLSGKKKIAGGNQPVNLIHLEDCVDFIQTVIDKHLIGVYNLVYPAHPTRKEYYESYCQRNNLPLPEFIDSPNNGKIISSDRVSKFYSLHKKL